MKAAVLYEIGTLPKYVEEYQEPKETDDTILVEMIASTIKQLDRGKVSGKHYLSYKEFPTTIGVDGVGKLENGQLVYGMGVTGMIAGKALIKKGAYVELSNDSDPYVAAALPNTLLGSDIALLYRAQIKKGDVVLVSGATGVTGKMAVQMARIRGASKVIAAGRNEESLKELVKDYGADEYIVLGDEQSVATQMKTLLTKQPLDIVIDYLWGAPISMIINAIVAQKVCHTTKIVSVGEMAGPNITLSSATLRSTAIELLGSGFGSFEASLMIKYYREHLNELIGLVKEGKLKLDIKKVDLKDIESEWLPKANDASIRLVVKIL